MANSTGGRYVRIIDTKKLNPISITRLIGVYYLTTIAGKTFVHNPRRKDGVVYILNGRMQFDFDGNTFECVKNDVIYIPANSVYSVKYLEDCSFVIFNFRVDKNYPLNITHNDEANLYNSYKKIQNYALSKNAHSYCLIMSELYYVLSVALSQPVKNKKNDEILDMAKKIIDEGFHKSDFICSEISKDLGISETYLRTLFKKKFGLSPSQYLSSVRMNEASELLSDGRSVTETALLVGYSDIYQFSKAYKKFYGHSPKSSSVTSYDI